MSRWAFYLCMILFAVALIALAVTPGCNGSELRDGATFTVEVGCEFEMNDCVLTVYHLSDGRVWFWDAANPEASIYGSPMPLLDFVRILVEHPQPRGLRRTKRNSNGD